ncbi:MAG TPA: AAA family ATPase [Terriglobales bacterium]|nr:AAA family ATPase [Terriglobales bacterium]
MKNLYLIGGTMGVGKTAVCKLLRDMLPNSVFLDGDWCWDMHPFVVNGETKSMVMDNICHLLQNFTRCSVFDNTIFCWVMHEQTIIDDILTRLDTSDYTVKCVSLVCGAQALSRRLQKDVDAGLRTPDVIPRSLGRLPLYEALDTIKIDVSEISPARAAKIISRL